MKIIQIAIPVLEPHERREFEKWRVAGPEEWQAEKTTVKCY